MIVRKSLMVACLSGAAVLMTGCSRSKYPPLGKVHGVVTLDGKPLADIMVNFQPVSPGRSSVGITSGEGRYELSFTESAAGAVVGAHEVTFSQVADGNNSQVAKNGSLNVPSYLTKKRSVAVKAGLNEFDFELSGK